MPTGMMTLACFLSLTGAQAGSERSAGEIPMNVRDIELPIRIPRELQGDLRELELYYSRDRGRQWQLSGRATPQQQGFPFIAAEDGPYWFTVLAIDKRNRKEPAEPHVAPIAQKVLIDTLKPDVRILSLKRVLPGSDEIEVRWDIEEENASLATMRMEYRSSTASTWKTVSIAPKLTGSVTVRVGPAAGSLRIRIDDIATNAGLAEARFAEAIPETVARRDAVDVPKLSPELGSIAVPPPPPGAYPSLPNPVGDDTIRRVGRTEAEEPSIDRVPEVVTDGPKPATIADTAGAEPARSVEAAARSEWESPEQIPVVKDKRVTLEYEVTKLGPSGVGEVELYVTRDDGRTWNRFTRVQHSPSPREATGRSVPGVMHRTLAIDLEEEGVYGFHLVVKSGAGLGEPGPSAGDAPQMRLELDTTLPVAALYPLELHPSQSHTLMLRWRATDKNLATKPISLFWAAQPSGPWAPIGEREMENAGTHGWTVSANVPARVFLRLVVRDRAGNVAIAQTPEPILVDLHKPKVKALRLIGN